MDTDAHLTYELYSSDFPRATFVREVLRRALPYVHAFSWRTDVTDLGPLRGHRLVEQKESSGQEALIQVDECLVVIEVSQGFVKGHISGAREQVDAVTARLKAAFPEAQGGVGAEIPITFWRGSARGPAASSRRIAVEPWEQVASNYPALTVRLLGPLMNDFRPGSSGRLLLWHGDPGTGKSHALRTLGWEWREWCAIEYVIDPERFLGDSDYLLRILLHEPEEDFERHMHEHSSQESRWRLLVLEDAGELVSAQAREQVGQQLSRLLNTVDGLLGEGLKLMMLITTNEPLGRMHPAVARPGRCAAEIEFTCFGTQQARAWLAARGVTAIPPADPTLADLFALTEGGQLKSRPRAVNDGLYM